MLWSNSSGACGQPRCSRHAAGETRSHEVACWLAEPFSLESFLCGMRYNLPHRSFSFPGIDDHESAKGDNVDFVMFEDVDGMEVFVNPERVIWVSEYPNQTTVISCGQEDKLCGSSRSSSCRCRVG